MEPMTTTTPTPTTTTTFAVGLFCPCGQELTVEGTQAGAREFTVRCSDDTCPVGISERGANVWIAIEFWMHEQKVRAALPSYVPKVAEEGRGIACTFCHQTDCNDIESFCHGPEVRRRFAAEVR